MASPLAELVETAGPAASATAPLRVLHVFSNFVPAGPEMRAVALIGALGPRLHHLVVSMDGRTSAASRLPDGVRVELLPSPPRRGSLATCWEMRRLLARVRPDLVLTYNWGAFDTVLAAALAGVRALVHHEDGFNDDEAGRLKVRRVLARRIGLRAARRVVVPSRRLEGIARRRWRVPAERLVRIPNGVVVAPRYRPDGHPELRRRVGIPAEALVVGTVAHLRAEKALSRLLAACAGLSGDCHLLVVGDGPEREALEAASAEPSLRGRVHLVGHQDDPRPWYRAMDVFAASSRTEQLPVSLLEAMAAGLPVVATAVGDVGEALPEQQASLLVAPSAGDVPGELRARLRRLLDDPRLRRRLGAANRARVEERYGFAAMHAAYAEVYRQALAPSARERWPAAGAA